MKISNKKIWLIGSSGMLGSALNLLILKKNYNIITKNRSQVNLLKKNSIEKFIKQEKPDIIINCAAKVGGIFANNSFPADFIYENTLMGLNIIDISHKLNVKKLVNFGSSCTYPNISDRAIDEEMLGRGFPEVTNQWYSFAKLNSIKMSEAYNSQFIT